MGRSCRRLRLFEPSPHGAFLQAVNVFFYIAVHSMVGTFEPFPSQDHGKLRFAFR